MPRQPSDDLESFLKRQDPSTLVSVLVELANEHEAVQARLNRLQLADQPDKLAAGFRRTLTAWRRSTRFVPYGEAGEFGRTLEAWLAQVERELLPKAPIAALMLFEGFIEADATFFERADDSGGSIGDAVRAACRHWLTAAARCPRPLHGWTNRLVLLFSSDKYGARDELLRRADLLLDVPALHALVTVFEARLAHTLAAPRPDHQLPHEVFHESAALSLLARCLNDPDIKVRAVLTYCPTPNEVQKQAFVEAYLEADRPADALTWLEAPWGRTESTRLELRSDALGRLGRFAESAAIRQNLFEQALSTYNLQRWLEHLPEASHAAARERAHHLALNHDDPITSATLLLHLGDDQSAEAILIAEPLSLRGDSPGAAPLAKALEAHHRPRGATVIYRALVTGILDRANPRAYRHGADYWVRLCDIADEGVALLPLASHEAYAATICTRHARKTAFWARVNATRRSGGE